MKVVIEFTAPTVDRLHESPVTRNTRNIEKVKSLLGQVNHALAINSDISDFQIRDVEIDNEY